jgi:hypothetical protein
VTRSCSPSTETTHVLADDGTVYVLKFPAGRQEYEFVSLASYRRLERELDELRAAKILHDRFCKGENHL